MELATLVICFLCLMVMSVPIAYNLILSSLAYMIVSDVPIIIITQKMYEGLKKSPFSCHTRYNKEKKEEKEDA